MTERAGALLTKVLEIREMPNQKVPTTKQNIFDKTFIEDEIDEIPDREKEDLTFRRAAVVDACISDLGSMSLHTHPLLWRSKEKSNRDDWEVVQAGKDGLWGSICMEFDVLGYGIQIPEDAKPGDLVLLTFCGAYDMSMSYNFADGKGRDIRVL